MTKKEESTPRGILNPEAAERRFQLTRHTPAQDLAFFVERYWIVRWELEGEESFTQETLPYPCVNLVFERGRSGIFGVVRQKFSRHLEGKGRAFGIKFRPGAFYPFVQSPISDLTDASIRVSDAFDVDVEALEAAILSPEDDEQMIERAEAFLRERLPERDERIVQINRIIDRIAADPAITKVDDVVHRFDVSKRTLQRLFRRYVGVGPKWVIQRYRLQEAADRLSRRPSGEAVDWTEMALDLGYFDQAHFINDFKAIVGVPPAEYARHARRTTTDT